MDLLVLLVSFGVIVAGAELFTNGVEWLGRKLELSEGAVGSVFAAIGTAPNGKALEMLMTYTSEADFTEDAFSAIVKLAEAAAAEVPKEQQQKALQLVVDKSDSDPTRKQARKLLKGAQ